MTALPLRPALADVLAAIVPHKPLGHERQWLWLNATRIVFATIDGNLCASPFGGGAWFPVVSSDPSEAFEILTARGVLPDEWAGDVRRAFIARYKIELGFCDSPNTTSTTTAVLTPHPATIPALVAWASLGAAAILRAEELARETVLRLRPWGAPQTERVVWRVGGRDEHKLVWSSDGGGHEVCSCGRGDPQSSPAAEIYATGLALDGITADAVTIVVPPVGAS